MPSKPLRAIKPMFRSPSSWNIVAGDRVQVMVGKDSGKQGEVLSVVRDRRFPRVFVSGVNMVTRHIRGGMDRSGLRVPGYSVKYEVRTLPLLLLLLPPGRANASACVLLTAEALYLPCI